MSAENIISKIQGDAEFLSYEIVPQKAFSLDSIIDGVKNSALFDRFDAFICTDSPLARLKHSAILASIKVQNALQKPTICTISVRDKNSIALQGEIIGLNEFDIRVFLALRGDPISLGDQPQAKAVFESGSHMIFEIIKCLNNARDLQNHALKDRGKRIYALAVMNAFANDMENLYKRMARKIANGATALVTQPVYDVASAERLLDMLARANREFGANATLIFGFYPVSSLKTAEFLYHKLPGCFMPDSWIDALKSSQNEEKMGIELSRDLFKNLFRIHPKIHFMCANNIRLAEAVLL